MTAEIKSFVTPTASRDHQKRGFTLTEIAIVLGIVGLILGAIWVAAAAVYNNQKVAHANTSILQIAQAVRTLYSTATNTGLPTVAAFTDTVMCAKATPSDLTNAAPCGGAGTMLDMWPGGATTISSTTTNLGDGFAIEMTSVPQSACISLIVAVAGQTRDPGLFYAGTTAAFVLGIGSSAAPTTSGPPLTGAATPAAAAMACAAATNTIAFGFSLKS